MIWRHVTPYKEYVRLIASLYRLHDATGDDLGLVEHLAPNLEPGDVVVR